MNEITSMVAFRRARDLRAAQTTINRCLFDFNSAPTPPEFSGFLRALQSLGVPDRMAGTYAGMPLSMMEDWRSGSNLPDETTRRNVVRNMRSLISETSRKFC